MTTLTFGKHRGQEVSTVPETYLNWLVNPELRDGKRFDVPEAIQAEAKRLLHERNYAEFRLAGMAAEQTDYIIRGEGDAWGVESYPSLEAALERIHRLAFHYEDDQPRKFGKPALQFDVEDDRITVWEVLPSGHRRCVWHFSGWHWSGDNYRNQDGSMMDMGGLPGLKASLYSELMDESNDWYDEELQDHPCPVCGEESP